MRRRSGAVAACKTKTVPCAFDTAIIRAITARTIWLLSVNLDGFRFPRFRRWRMMRLVAICPLNFELQSSHSDRRFRANDGRSPTFIRAIRCLNNGRSGGAGGDAHRLAPEFEGDAGGRTTIRSGRRCGRLQILGQTRLRCRQLTGHFRMAALPISPEVLQQRRVALRTGELLGA